MTTDQDLARLGALLKERRRAAHLSRAELARRSKLSEGTLKNLEAGRHQPNHQTLCQLLDVKELGLGARDLLPAGSAPDLPAPTMNALLSPGCDAITLIRELEEQLAGPGGAIEPRYLYLDVKSAQSWMAFANHREHPAARHLIHLGAIAGLIRERLGTRDLDVIALGPGDGRREVALLEQLLYGERPLVAGLYLLDISQPLLSAAYKRAVEDLPPSVNVFAVQGDIHQLARYSRIFQHPFGAARQRLITLFGGTFGELNSEIQFLKNGLVGLVPGDLLLLQVTRTYAARADPQAVRQEDPALAGARSAELALLEREWLTGLFERHARQVGEPLPELVVETTLDLTSCAIPGSYAVEKMIIVTNQEQATKRFNVTYLKRYDLSGLTSCLAALGWETIKLGEEAGNQVMGVFERR